MAKINRKKQRRNLLILLCAFLLILGVFVKVVFMIVDTLFVSEQKVGEKQESKKENKLSKEDYTKYVVDELGNVPVMMYHGIHNIPSNETGYVGGNVDVDGYQRTAEAFRQDLQFYYDNGYRMIRLNDYINGNIDVEAGKSPICLTFDDGLENNILVTGTDKEGNEICLVDIVEGKNTDLAEMINKKQEIREMYHYMAQLNERERQILSLRYGILGQKETTQREIAQKLGISRSYVSRIEKNALSKLRSCFREKGKTGIRESR